MVAWLMSYATDLQMLTAVPQRCVSVTVVLLEDVRLHTVTQNKLQVDYVFQIIENLKRTVKFLLSVRSTIGI